MQPAYVLVGRVQLKTMLFCKKGYVVWPPRSCDLTMLDYYLWGASNDEGYVNNPETIQELIDEIQADIADISPDTNENVLKNWMDQMDSCQVSRGGLLTKIVFYT